VPLELAEAPDHALLRVVADRAGVDEDDVSTVRRVDGLVAVLGQAAAHQLGIADVHLAPVRLDVDGAASATLHAES
jgi:hypothetical protein